MGKQESILRPSDYVSLHNHTHYSLLDGLTKIPAMVQYVKETGMESIAVTDHGTLSGLIEFYKEATASGIKPIMGMEAYVSPRKHTDKEAGKDKAYYHLIILAMNMTGYKNLMRLSTIANLDGFYYKPRIDHELLEKYNEGLIILSACIGGELGDALRNEQYEQATLIASWYKSVFGDRYYIEVQDHGHPEHPSAWQEQVVVNERLLNLAKDLDIDCVLTSDSHYLQHEDQEAHEILLCVQTGSFVGDEKRMSLKEFELHIPDPNELIARWQGTHPEVISNTRKIADRCSIELELGKILIPKFSVPEGETEKTYLEKLVYEGIDMRYGVADDAGKINVSQEILKRTAYELSVIDTMGFNGYFLIIWDFISWGKNEGIVFGPGRGSAAGSIVAYSLRITELDPLKYNLLFERFLNPDRISMPDIDIDIQDSRRAEVIEYCVRKYGESRVANIVTFGKMAARNAVRDVARVLEVPYAEADRLAKMIPPPVQGRHIPLKKSLIENADLAHENETNQQSARVFDLATRLEGTIRSHGVHAAGVVIAPSDIVDYVPLEMAQKGVVATQYSMNPIEELGLLKMDFLGLSNLTIINNALRIIKKVYKQNIDINSIPLDDEKTFALLQRGDTTGVFQFESSGMKKYLRELKPTLFDDVIAMGALYRPGPLSAGLTDSFIRRKNGLEAVSLAHPLMKNALESTFGVLVYQEQVMQISRDVCGFTGGEADTLRKAIGKKKLDVMEKMRTKFIDGAVANGVSKQIIEKFWHDLLGFADYCFNKSHSACYGLISYQTAYLKAHYPSAFMAALMSSDYDDIDRLSIEIAECRHVGIEVLPPDINESYGEFAVVPKGDPEHDPIRFGMNAVKNVGKGVVEVVVEERLRGHFDSMADFLSRVPSRVANKKAMESLIRSGAFDQFGNRSVFLQNIEILLQFASRLQKEASLGQVNLFSELGDSSVVKPVLELVGSVAQEPTEQQKRAFLQWERELLGIYLSEHPLKMFEPMLAESTHVLSMITKDMDGKPVTVGGLVTSRKDITTKNGQKMAFVTLADMYNEIEVIFFPSNFQQSVGVCDTDNIVIIKGKVNAKDRNTGELINDIKLMAEDAKQVTIEQVAAFVPSGKTLKLPKASKNSVSLPSKKVGHIEKQIERLYIRIHTTDDGELLSNVKKLLDSNIGDLETVLVIGEKSDKKIIKLPQKSTADLGFTTQLRALVGEANVVVQ